MPVRLSSEHGLDDEWPECTLLRCQARANIVLARFTKGKASYGGHLLRHGWSGRRGELLRLNHVVDRVWKELSAEGANVINMPFSVARMNVYELLSERWKTGRSGGVALETSLIAVLRELALKLLRILYGLSASETCWSCVLRHIGYGWTFVYSEDFGGLVSCGSAAWYSRELLYLTDQQHAAVISLLLFAPFCHIKSSPRISAELRYHDDEKKKKDWGMRSSTLGNNALTDRSVLISAASTCTVNALMKAFWGGSSPSLIPLKCAGSFLKCAFSISSVPRNVITWASGGCDWPLCMHLFNFLLWTVAHLFSSKRCRS